MSAPTNIPNGISAKIHQTEAAIRRLEEEIARHPDERTLALSLESLKKRQRDLEADFAQAANSVLLDVCRYRLFEENSEGVESGVSFAPPIAGIANALSNFQAAFTLVYEAIKNGAKQRGTKNLESVEATTLRFNYAFTGSVGIVMSVQNDRILVDETNIEKAVRAVFQIAEATRAEDIHDYAQILGPAPIKVIYDWAHAHTLAGLGADVEWLHDNVTIKIRVGVLHLEVLQQAILASSEENVEDFVFNGRLVGADIKGRSFHFETAVGENIRDIRGRMADEFQISDELLGLRYEATIRQVTRTNLATGSEDTAYLLLRLNLIR